MKNLLILLVCLPSLSFSQSNYIIEDLTKEGSLQGLKMNLGKKFDVSGGTITGKAYFASTITMTGVGNGLIFPDGTRQITAGVGESMITVTAGQFTGNGSASSPLALVITSVTLQGNTFNGVSQLVKTNASGDAPVNITGNAATASSLAADPADCAAGNAPLGVNAAGTAVDCFDVGTQAEVNDKVSKAGDVMTGPLTISGSSITVVNATISDTLRSGGIIYFTGPDSGLIQHLGSNSNIGINTSGSGLLRLNRDVSGNIVIGDGIGRVGIGNASPAYMLDVTGGGHFTSSMTVDSGYYGSGSNLTGVITSTAAIVLSTGTIQTSLNSVILSTGTLDDAKVNRAGDVMTGQLTLSGSSLTVTGAGGIGATYGITAATFTGTHYGSGANLTSIPASAITAGTFGAGDYVFTGATPQLDLNHTGTGSSLRFTDNAVVKSNLTSLSSISVFEMTTNLAELRINVGGSGNTLLKFNNTGMLSTKPLTLSGSSLTVTGGGGIGVTYGINVATAVITNTGATSLDVAGGINAGSGNVGIIDTTGKIPALSSTYLADLSGTNLTGLVRSAGDIMTGQLTVQSSSITVHSLTTNTNFNGFRMLDNSALPMDFQINGIMAGGATTARFYGGSGVKFGFRPGADSSDILFMNMDSVGIGMDTPVYTLDIGDGGGAGGGAIRTLGQAIIRGTMTVVGNAFSVGGSTLVVKEGNVGIGTTGSFYGKLQVKVATDQNFVFRSGGATPTARIETINDAVTANVPMELVATQFNFAGGNVGMGTTSPGYTLDVAGVVKSTRMAVGSSMGLETLSCSAGQAIGGATVAGGILSGGSCITSGGIDNLGNHIATMTLNMGNYAMDNISSATITGTGVTGSNPLFKVAGSTMVVLNNGNVGIGTTAPASKLDVIGTISQSGVAIKAPETVCGIIPPTGGTVNCPTGKVVMFAVFGRPYLAGGIQCPIPQSADANHNSGNNNDIAMSDDGSASCNDYQIMVLGCTGASSCTFNGNSGSCNLNEVALLVCI